MRSRVAAAAMAARVRQIRDAGRQAASAEDRAAHEQVADEIERLARDMESR